MVYNRVDLWNKSQAVGLDLAGSLSNCGIIPSIQVRIDTPDFQLD